MKRSRRISYTFLAKNQKKLKYDEQLYRSSLNIHKKKNFDIYFNSLYYVSAIENNKIEYDYISYCISFCAGVRVFFYNFYVYYYNEYSTTW